MSYCRFAWNGSDVYVFESSSGIECCGCKLGTNFCTSEPELMIVHLGQHRRAGHYVPDHAILALWEDVPGAQRPHKPEPESITKACLEMEIALIQDRISKFQSQDKGGGQ